MSSGFLAGGVRAGELRGFLMELPEKIKGGHCWPPFSDCFGEAV
jgi:hypothetical protein